MKFLFVDTESVARYEFIDDTDFVPDDEIVIFRTDKSKEIKKVDLMRISNCNAKIRYVDVLSDQSDRLISKLISCIEDIEKQFKDEEKDYFFMSNNIDLRSPVELIYDRFGHDIYFYKTGDEEKYIPNIMGQIKTNFKGSVVEQILSGKGD